MKYVLTNNFDESYCGDDVEGDLQKFATFKSAFEKKVAEELTEEELVSAVENGMFKVHNGDGDNKGYATVYNVSKSVHDDDVMEIDIVYMSSFINGQDYGTCLCFETFDWLDREKPIRMIAY